ncbi:unnamed protein product, partial [Hapterophycus canaliculatus]
MTQGVNRFHFCVTRFGFRVLCHWRMMGERTKWIIPPYRTTADPIFCSRVLIFNVCICVYDYTQGFGRTYGKKSKMGTRTHTTFLTKERWVRRKFFCGSIYIEL